MAVRLNYLGLFFGILALGLYSCKSSQSASSMEEYLPYTEKESILYLPLLADLDTLGHMLDSQLDSVLAEEGGNFSDGSLEVLVEKLGPIQLQAEGQHIRYNLPLALQIRYDAGLGSLKADGQVELAFRTDYQVDSTWNLDTRTEMEDYLWLKQPRLRLGFVTLPAGILANWVIQFGKKEISRIIDEQIQENVPLRAWIDDAWQTIREPLLLEEDLSAWMVANPTALAISPIEALDRKIRMVLRAECRPFMAVGSKPDSLGAPRELPRLGTFTPEGETGFALFVRASLPYERAEDIARENFLNEEFSSGKRTVTIKDLTLFGKKDKLVVSMDMTGSYNGKVEVSGKPVYRERGNRIVLKDLDYTLKTRNFLHKTAGWMMKSTLINRLQDEMDFFLESNLTEWKALLEEQINALEIEEGIQLRAEVADLKVEDTFLAPDAIVVDVGLRGDMEVEIRSF